LLDNFFIDRRNSHSQKRRGLGDKILSVARKLPVARQTSASATESTYLQFSLNVL
jgi:hypothetical protein